jgi:hypothetical protein
MGTTLKRECMVPGAPNTTFYWVNDEPVSERVFRCFADNCLEKNKLREELDRAQQTIRRLKGEDGDYDEHDWD